MNTYVTRGTHINPAGARGLDQHNMGKMESYLLAGSFFDRIIIAIHEIDKPTVGYILYQDSGEVR